MSLAAELQTTVAELAEDVGRSVVGIGTRWGAGSGIVVGPGRVLTNAHNVRRDEVRVTFADGREAVGKPLGVDVDGDLAVIEVDTKDAPQIGWSETAPAIGMAVFALSNPGGRGLRVTFGLISGTQRSFRGPRGRRIAGSIEHTAPLLPGSSGGPTVDAAGQLLGINTNRLGEGFYLAIPAADTLRKRVDALAAGQTPKRARLGLGLAPGHVARGLRRAVGLPEMDGLLVRLVEDDSPAADAGIKEGDLITHAAGRAVSSVDDLYDVLGGTAPGDRLELNITRGTDEITIEVTPTDS
jgi:serine protease Do